MMRRRNLVRQVALQIVTAQWRHADERERQERPARMVALYAGGSDFYCPNCGDVKRDEVKQVERDECCLYACRRCDAVVDEPIPF